MYRVSGKSRRVEREFESLLSNFEESEKKKLMTTLAKAPKGLPPNLNVSVELLGRVEKKGKRFWQYYATDGNRIIYDVLDKPKRVIIQFAGNHDDAQAFLRQNG